MAKSRVGGPAAVPQVMPVTRESPNSDGPTLGQLKVRTSRRTKELAKAPKSTRRRRATMREASELKPPEPDAVVDSPEVDTPDDPAPMESRETSSAVAFEPGRSAEEIARGLDDALSYEPVEADVEWLIEEDVEDAEPVDEPVEEPVGEPDESEFREIAPPPPPPVQSKTPLLLGAVAIGGVVMLVASAILVLVALTL